MLSKISTALTYKLVAGGATIAILIGTIVWWTNRAYNNGIDHQKAVYAEAQRKLAEKVEEAEEEATIVMLEEIEKHNEAVEEEAEKINEAYRNNRSTFDVMFPSE